MTTDGEARIKLERRSQDDDDSFVNQNSSSGTPGREAAGKARIRGRMLFEKDKISFLQDLQLFHDKNGTPFMRPPKIGGRDVDLHKLYSVVVARGGWLKVNSREDWDEVIDELHLPKRCVNNEIAIKQIYIRYLDRYERVNFHGEEKDPAEDEDDEKRHNRRWSARMLHSVPTAYNHQQHFVPEAMRGTLNLSCDLYKPSEYDKLILSLMSPLPNEQDFSINVCTLMSNESKHTLKVDKCPKLITVLLAHAGVYNHYSLRDMFDEFYTNIRKHNLHRFWKDCLFEKPQVLELSYNDYFQKMERDPTALIKSIYHEDSGKDIEDDAENGCGKLNISSLRSFLSLGAGLGTNDYLGQRILQIASIFRNLSFNDENVITLARHTPFLRFLIMCANSRWSNLHHMGLDMLGNVAIEIDINDPQTDEISRCLLSTISEGLEGVDRGIIISCLEILSKIAQKESNEDNLNRSLNQKIYNQICMFLSLSDIMLLLYTLECIYSLTSMGEKACSAVVHVTGIIDTLVSLVTVEAQSYGPDACILMRVVETIPGNLSGYYPGNHYQNTGPVQSTQAPSMAQLTVQSKEHPPIPLPNIPTLPELMKLPVPTKPHLTPPSTPQPSSSPAPAPSPAPNSSSNNNVQVTNVTRPGSSQSPQIPVNIISRNDPSSTATPQKATSAATPAANTGTPAGPITVAAKHAQQQQSQENEQFAYAWLRATFETTPSLGIKLEQTEMYRLYLAANAKIGRKAVVPQVHFPRCVRTVFGGTVGPTQHKTEQNGVEAITFYYEGIKLRPKPPTNPATGPVVTATATTPQKGTPMQGPPAQILQQVLNSSQAGDTKNVIVVNQTTISPQPLGTIAPPPQPPQHTTGTTTIMNQSGTISSTTTNPSALIKSLLANKVTTTTATGIESSNAASIVVTSSTSSSLSSTTTSINPPTSTSNCLIASNVNMHQVAQRQQLLKQKQLSTQSQIGTQLPNSSVVVTSNNPNNLTNIKVGNSTISIKPGTLPTNTVITATNPHEKDQLQVQLNPPPLAPLSQTTGTIIKPITTNKMLVDLLDQKANEPPVFAIGETTVKRKTDADALEPPSKKLDLMDTKEVKVTPKAADLYAELAGSILEGEDLEDVDMKIAKEEPKIKVQSAPTQQVITVPMQRQIIMAPNNPQSMLLSPGAGGQQLTAQTTATIKTDTGYQTVPVILQHNQSPIQIQKTAPVMQPAVISNPQQPTQYILATNPQGQTYVVAQQPQPQPQMQQTVLLTQSPQHGNQQKTIIILQQPPQNTGTQIQSQQIVQAQPATPQKVFVNQQGQQIIMTQVPRQVQHQVIVSHAPTNTSGTPTPVNPQTLLTPGSQMIEKKPIYITTNQQGNTISIEGATQQIIKPNQPATQIIQTHLGQQQQQFVIQPQVAQPQQSQIVIQSQPKQSQLQPQIISQQIIQPAAQPQIVQKILQQKIVPGSQPAQPQVITVQKQVTSVQSSAHPQSTTLTVTKQTISPSPHQPAGPLPTKTIIVQQPTAGTTQKQIIQVVQQKITTAQPIKSGPITPSSTQKPSQLPTTPAVKSISQITTVPETSTTAPSPTVSTPVTAVSAPVTEANSVSAAISSTTLAPPIVAQSPSTATTVASAVAKVSAPVAANSQGSTALPATTTIPLSGSSSSIQMIPAMDPAKVVDEDVEPSWPWICDWRGCPKKKFASANEVYMHACAVHCPDSVDSTSDIYCQWGPGPNLCDNLPRKRFSLMTHIFDRHCTSESFKSAVQRRMASAASSSQQPQQAYPVTLVRQPAATPPGSSASSTTSESSACATGSQPQPATTTVPQGPGHLGAAGPAALHAIKRHAIDWINAKEFQDDIEGPVTKSIRLTSALILRNLVVYNNTARRALRAYEPHLAGVAMNNVESSRTISQVLFEMNDTRPNF